MALFRPIFSVGGKEPGPRPVPEFGSNRLRKHRRPVGLVTKSTAIAVVVVLGAAASGISGSRNSAAPVVNRGKQAPSIVKQASSATTAVTVAPVTTTTSTDPPPPSAPASQATSTSTPPITTPISDSSIIQASGTQLFLNGSTYKFVGVNAYEAATEWGTNAGCGAELSGAQLNQLFASLPPNSLVRFWAFQGTMATNVNTGQLDWGPIDRVFGAAAAHNQRLVVVLTDQGGTCDGGHWQDPSWYEGGFKDVFNGPSNSNGMGLDTLSYWTYLQDIVSRYSNSRALGMWEPISEPGASSCPTQYEPTNCSGHATCTDEAAAAASMRYFFDTVGAEIHILDPKHLVESGMLGSGQCGTAGPDYQHVSASPGIDILSYHDYYGAVPQWNGLAVRFAQSAALGKPIIGGEVGLNADTAPGCTNLAARNTDFASKVQAQFSAGSSGILAWDWVPTPAGTCTTDIGPSDPLIQPGGAIG